MTFVKSGFPRLAHGAGLIAVLAMFACESPPPTTPAGLYTATRFVGTISGGVTVDQIASGGSIVLVLNEDGTTSGQMNVAAAGGLPAHQADLTGTWAISDSTVTFDHPADTFIRDAPFKYDGKTLVADQTFGGGDRVQATLRRD